MAAHVAVRGDVPRAGPSRPQQPTKRAAPPEGEEISDDEAIGPIVEALDLQSDEEDDEYEDVDKSEDGADDAENDFLHPHSQPNSEEDAADDDVDEDPPDTSDNEATDDEDSGSESGYNSSDIDQSESSSSTSPSEFPHSTDEKLSRLISKNSIKPDESLGAVGKISTAKEGGKLVRSQLVDGGFRRGYEDIEAGYGSESSTEDVSG